MGTKFNWNIETTFTRSEVFKAIEAGREVQEFLWKDSDYQLDADSSIEDWVNVFQKRVDKISKIDKSNPMYKVELKKRLLQQAALSIAALEKLEEEGECTNKE